MGHNSSKDDPHLHLTSANKLEEASQSDSVEDTQKDEELDFREAKADNDANNQQESTEHHTVSRVITAWASDSNEEKETQHVQKSDADDANNVVTPASSDAIANLGTPDTDCNPHRLHQNYCLVEDQEPRQSQSVRLRQNYCLDGEHEGISDYPADSTLSLNSTASSKKRRYSQFLRFFTPKVSMKIVPEELVLGDVVMCLNTTVPTPSHLFNIVTFEPSEDLDKSLPNCNAEMVFQLKDKLQITSVYQAKQLVPTEKVEDDHISSKQLYNSLVDGVPRFVKDGKFHLIIDARTEEEYRKLHIQSAIHYRNFTQNLPNYEPFKEYKLIVIYDVDGLSVSLHQSILSDLFKTLILMNGDPFVLQGGFKAFSKCHPYFCCETVDTTYMDLYSTVNTYPSMILPEQLYLGRADQASKAAVLKSLSITHVIRVTQDPHSELQGVTYHYVPITDERSTNILVQLADVINFIDGCFRGDESARVLVHCNMGVSRSPTIVIAYLMYICSCDLASGYNFVKMRRPVIKPNNGFLRQLSLFEKLLFGKRISELATLRNGDSAKAQALRKDSEVQTGDADKNNDAENIVAANERNMMEDYLEPIATPNTLQDVTVPLKLPQIKKTRDFQPDEKMTIVMEHEESKENEPLLIEEIKDCGQQGIVVCTHGSYSVMKGFDDRDLNKTSYKSTCMDEDLEEVFEL